MKLVTALSALLMCSATLAATSNGKGVDENCDLARSLAINNALERFSMREFEASQKHVCKDIKDDITCYYQKEIATEISGTFKRLISFNNKQRDGLCFVAVEIEVEKARPLDVMVTGKDKYLSGDIFELTVKTKEPLFVYIYNDHVDGLQKLYPVLENKHELVLGTFRIEDNKKVKYVVSVNAPYERSEDTVIVVFSKVRMTFKSRLTKSEFYDTIKSVPTFSRRIVYHNVVIDRR